MTVNDARGAQPLVAGELRRARQAGAEPLARAGRDRGGERML